MLIIRCGSWPELQDWRKALECAAKTKVKRQHFELVQKIKVRRRHSKPAGSNFFINIYIVFIKICLYKKVGNIL